MSSTPMGITALRRTRTVAAPIARIPRHQNDKESFFFLPSSSDLRPACSDQWGWHGATPCLRTLVSAGVSGSGVWSGGTPLANASDCATSGST